VDFYVTVNLIWRNITHRKNISIKFKTLMRLLSTDLDVPIVPRHVKVIRVFGLTRKFVKQSQQFQWQFLKQPPPPETDLHAKIDNLERVIERLTVLVKNQQPTTINNDNSVNNSINKTNYINIFLNNKCHNACDIRKFIAVIDFSKENFQNILKDYVGGNAVISTALHCTALHCTTLQCTALH
jgi:hypothetical protein